MKTMSKTNSYDVSQEMREDLRESLRMSERQKRCFWIFRHDWEKWAVSHDSSGAYAYIELRRTCKNCGRLQLRYVKKL